MKLCIFDIQTYEDKGNLNRRQKKISRKKFNKTGVNILMWTNNTLCKEIGNTEL